MNTKFLKYLMLLSALIIGGMLVQTSAQTTEGKDFWVTFMRADNSDPTNLSLTFSAKRACDVTIRNEITGFEQVEHVDANSAKMVENLDKSICYVDATNQALPAALHITASDTISVFASNYRKQSSDASIVLPSTALRSEYYAQMFPASDHGGNNQGTHFAIVAIEDNTVVEYTPTTNVYNTSDDSWQYANQTYLTDTLKAGQVWYVWSGKTNDESSDLSGTHILAHDNKPIAVFLGNPHTNIPHEIRDRDHLYEQAMPVDFWGTQFVITGSLLKYGTKRAIDYVKITARDDNTILMKNGVPFDTISFEKGTKLAWTDTIAYKKESPKIININNEYAKRTITLKVQNGEAFYLQSSCPVEVFLYMTSNVVDDKDNKTNGDPSMVWINPIEQQLSDITFLSYKVYSPDNDPEHFVNVVTDATTAQHMMLDGTDISSQFNTLEAMPYYAFAQIWLGNQTDVTQHHLQSTNGGGFIAHAYGFGTKESYAYSAGGATKELKQVITINGKEFTAETNNQLCGVDTILFECNLNYVFQSIKWDFGDGKIDDTGKTSIKHNYEKDGVYQASVVIERLSSILCQGQTAKDSIPITVTIGRMRINIDSIDQMICAEKGSFKIFYSNPMEADLSDGNVFFNDIAKANGFTDDNLKFTDKYFEISVPQDAKSAQDYALNIVLKSDCGSDTVDVPFTLNYKTSLNLSQRANDILAVRNQDYNELHLDFVGFQWYRNGQALEGETNSYLNLNGEFDYESEFYVCLKTAAGDSLCSCPAKFTEHSTISVEGNNSIYISATSVDAGGDLYVTTNEEGQYSWYDATGKLLKSGKLPVGGAIISAPDKKGFSLLSIKAEDNRNFKIIIK